MIRLAFDFTSPQCYFALQPTFDLAEELSVSLLLLPYQVKQREVRVESGSETIGERHMRVRDEYGRMDDARYAELLGLPLKGNTATDSTNALVLTQSLNPEVRNRFVRRIFHEFWNGSIELSDWSALSRIVQGMGETDINRHDLTTAQLLKTREALEREGVANVPTYLVGDEVFQGRQHLPMIRWLLNGRRGRLPL